MEVIQRRHEPAREAEVLPWFARFKRLLQDVSTCQHL